MKILPPLARVFISGLIACAPLLVCAQNVETITQREVARRQARVPRGEEALARAQNELRARQFAQSHEDFRIALTLLPAGESSYSRAMKGFCESGVKLAQQRMADGQYAEAEVTLNEVLNDHYNPNCREATELLTRLHDPAYINKTTGPKFMAKVEQVKAWLAEAEGFYQSGRYDLAMKRYNQVLNLDPYNTAARRGQERIDNTKYRYGQEAYNETRGRAMWQVEHGWEEPVPKYLPGPETITAAQPMNVSNTARINNKLNSIVIPRIEFRDASVREAIDFLRQQGIANDPTSDGKRGVDIVVRVRSLGRTGPPAPGTTGVIEPTPLPAGENAPPAATGVTPAPAAGVTPSSYPPPAPGEARVTLTLNQIPLGEALRYVAAQAGLKIKVEPYAVLVLPLSEQSNELITKRYHVPPEFFGAPLDIGAYLGQANPSSANQQSVDSQLVPPLVADNILEKDTVSIPSTVTRNSTSTSSDYLVNNNSNASTTQISGGGQAEIKLRQQLTNDRQLVGRATARQYLETMGVYFPPGASATFLPQSAVLIVRNTQDNLDMVDALVEQANLSRPKQVEIESKFVEITQNNLKELGFDWLLGQFNIGNHKVFGSGGTTGTGLPPNQADFPFPVDGQFPVTAGNRSGNLAISANALDALLLGTGGLSGVAPGIFGLSGVFTDPQFQVVIRALNQKRGVDLLSAPRVTTKSGQRAVIEIVREFRFPTKYTPPQIPQTVGALPVASTGGTTFLALGGGGSSPVTPTTPTDFTTRNTGVILEVEPVVGSDGLTIDLNLVPQVIEFEGFINYGSPILSPSSSFINTVTGGLITAPPTVITPNVINQPIFSTRKVNTSVSIYDGSTVVLGGLMREDVQKTEDRTPIIGDIPVVGRLFRTNVDQHIKRNLVIFVTAHLVTPGGELVRAEDEEEIMPPELPEVPLYKK